jgi:hypothetical protein
MCLVLTETKKGPVHQQCSQAVYGSVNFLNISKKEQLIYWCPHCRKVAGSSLTVEQLSAEWEQKDIKFKITKF